MGNYRFHIKALCSLFVIIQLSSLAFGQRLSDLTPSRIKEAISEDKLVTLKGNTHPLAKAAFDQGPAPGSLPLNRMMLVLKRSPEQQAALKALLSDVQDKKSAGYHQWLTPQEFGQRFGASTQDLDKITGWLRSHGFTIGHVANSRSMVEFSGSVDQVRETFRTSIHKYTVHGQDHWANASDPQIPAALLSVVGGVATLNNFRRNLSLSRRQVWDRNRSPEGRISTVLFPGLTIPATHTC